MALSTPPASTTAPAKKNPGSGCLKGCLIFIGIIFVIIGAVVVYLYYNAAPWFGSMLDKAGEQFVRELELPDAEKKQALDEIHRFSDKLRNGEVSVSQLISTVDQFTKGPVVPVLAAEFFSRSILQQSGLTPEEKESGRLQVARFSYGVANRTISEQRVEAIVNVFAPSDKESAKRKIDLSDEQIRQVLTEMRKESDAANIPNDVAVEMSLHQELRKAIDAGLGNKQ